MPLIIVLVLSRLQREIAIEYNGDNLKQKYINTNIDDNQKIQYSLLYEHLDDNCISAFTTTTKGS